MEPSIKYPIYEWELLQDTYYQKSAIGKAEWEYIDPVDFMFAVAPCGGAIAITRSESNLQSNYKYDQVPMYSICVFCLSGQLLQTLTWDKTSLVGMGWNENEELIVVSKQGQVRVYNLLGEFHQFSLGKGVENIGIRECQFSEGGVFALLQNDTFISITGFEEPWRKTYASIPFNTLEYYNIDSWALIPNPFSPDLGMDIVVTVGSHILQIDEQDSQLHSISSLQHVSHISISPNARYLALYESVGKVRVISSDFSKELLDLRLPETVAEASLKQMAWCGNDAVVLVHENLLTLVGPFGGSVPYLYNHTPIVSTEVDGVRILTKDSSEFLRKVPAPLENIFHIGSKTPGAKLVEAFQKMKLKSVFAEKMLLELKDELHDAVDTCVQASLNEFSIEWQKVLLEAASLGKNSLRMYNHQEYVDVCRELRVLNAARDPNVGIYITHEEYLHLGLERLIQRFSCRQLYGLAVQASMWMQIPCDWVYIQWAQTYIKQSSEPEEVVLDNIVKRLSSRKYISYEKIARTAYQEGRLILSTKLLDFEPLAKHQVMLLLNMEAYEQALKKVIETMDNNLIIYVVLQIKQQMAIASFFQILNEYPDAVKVYVEFAKKNDRKTLHDFFYQDDNKQGIAVLAVEDTLKTATVNQRITSLKSAAKVCSESKELSLEEKCLGDEIKLLQLQQTYEDQFTGNFVGLTVNEVVVKLIQINQTQRANKLRSEFQIPEKRFAWLKLRALVAIRDWVQIEQWAGSMRRSPIGFEPFVTEILSAGNKKEAAKYIPRCTQLTTQEKVDMWVQVGDVKSASEEAAKSKSGSVLGDLLERVQTMPESRFVQNALDQLRR
ncbi:hypothetical protein POMI540_1304 [Schizosaccharomyces pombe]